MTGMNILVIPDSHAHPKHDNRRMLWLGEYILDKKPDVVLHIGDLADLPSLSTYDQGTMRAWGRFYKADIAASVEHQEFLWKAVEDYNMRRRANRKAQYKPKRVYVKGNHEDRADRFVQAHPQFDGFVNIDEDLQLERFWDVIVPYGDEIVIGGIGFTHYYRNAMGRPLGTGVMPARALSQKKARSVVQGHNHRFSVYFQDRGHGNPKIQTFTVGYYGHPEHLEDWNLQSQAEWDFGVLMLYNVQDGMAMDGFRWMTQDALERKYAERAESRLAGTVVDDDSDA